MKNELLSQAELIPLYDFYPSVGVDINKLSYLAGLFDGEGCVRIEINKLKNPKRMNQFRDHLESIIANTYLPVLEECKILFGGHVKKSSMGNKQCWQWKLLSLSAAIFLSAIFPYTKIKRDQIGLALEYVRVCKNRKSTGQKGLSEEEKSKRSSYARVLSEMKKAG